LCPGATGVTGAQQAPCCASQETGSFVSSIPNGPIGRRDILRRAPPSLGFAGRAAGLDAEAVLIAARADACLPSRA